MYSTLHRCSYCVRRLRPRKRAPFEQYGETLTEVVLDHIGRQPKRFGTIYDDVINDFGTVTRRVVHRRLRELIARKAIVYEGKRSAGTGKYRRSTSQPQSQPSS